MSTQSKNAKLSTLEEIKLLVDNGDFSKAKADLEKSIKNDSDNVELYNLLGGVNHAQENYDEAHQAFEKSLAIQPEQESVLLGMAQLHSSQGAFETAINYFEKLNALYPSLQYIVFLGQCHENLGDINRALDYYLTAFNHGVKNADFVSGLGLMLKKQQRFSEAELCYKEALSLEPNNIFLVFGLAELFQSQKQYEAAITGYQEIVRQFPENYGAYNNLASALISVGRYQEALNLLLKLLEQEPENHDAYVTLSNGYSSIGNLIEAEKAVRKAIELRSDNYATYYNLANILQKNGKIDESLACYKKSIECNPMYSGSYNNMGNVYKTLGKCAQAIESFNKALELSPNDNGALSNLGSAYFNSGLLDEAGVRYREALRVDPTNFDAFSNFLYYQSYISDFCDEDIYQYHIDWCRKATSYTSHDPVCQKPIIKSSVDKIRLGFVSKDFVQHSVAFFAESFFEAYDRSRFEVYCYTNNPNEDDISARIKANVDNWQSIVGMSDAVAMQQIQQDNIHVLIDLSGHTSGHRLGIFLGKPAPIQVSWLGYPNTTGLSQIDYRITDNIVDPVGVADNLHVEQLVRLPNIFLCYTGDENIELASTPPLEDNKYITFGSFNHTPKITEQVLETWACVLLAVPKSRLIIKCKGLADESIADRVRKKFEHCGVQSSRVELISFVPNYYDHMKMYNRIDIGLDTFPYSGTTTSFEAMWMGIPIITIDRGNHRSRVSKSILTQVGLEKLVAYSLDEYVSIAKKLAKDTDKLRTIRGALRDKMQNSPLCDKKAFANNMGNAFEMMVQRSVM